MTARTNFRLRNCEPYRTVSNLGMYGITGFTAVINPTVPRDAPPSAQAGVVFVSDPVAVPFGPDAGSRALYLQDPDSIRIELVETRPA